MDEDLNIRITIVALYGLILIPTFALGAFLNLCFLFF